MSLYLIWGSGVNLQLISAHLQPLTSDWILTLTVQNNGLAPTTGPAQACVRPAADQAELGLSGADWSDTGPSHCLTLPAMASR